MLTVFMLGGVVSRPWAQESASSSDGWKAASSTSGEPARLPDALTSSDLPTLPPPRFPASPGTDVSPSRLLSAEPLLDVMLYEHTTENSTQNRNETPANSRPQQEGPQLTGQTSGGLLGQMLQQQSPIRRTTVVRPRVQPAAHIPQPVVPAQFQDGPELGPPGEDVPPLPFADTVPAPPGTDVEDVAPPSATPQGTGTTNRAAGDEPTLGEAPEEDETYLQFLRTQTILLDPGEHQLDVTFQYLNNVTDFSFVERDADDNAQIITLRRRQRLVLVPIELRYGLSCTTQGFVNVPLGWSSDEVILGTEENTSDSVGIGDVSFGITEILMDGEGLHPDILATFAVTAPTGDANIAASLAVPGSSLGAGFWGFTAALNFIYSYDPVVVYYGFGFNHRLDHTFDGGIKVNPGEQILYRLGVGFAVNSHITLSASFNGSFITETQINEVIVSGSDQEPMSLRLAATIAKETCPGEFYAVKTVEPFANFGITNDAIDAIIGVSWTH